VPRVESIREEVLILIRSKPFQKFVLNFENGDRIVIEHPENIAFDPEATGPGSDQFYVLSNRIRLFSTFAAVTSVALADQGGAAA